MQEDTMTRFLRTIRSLFIEIIFAAIWLFLIAGTFIVALGVIATLPYSEAKVASAVLSFASLISVGGSLYRMKVVCDEQNGSYAPLLRDMLFAVAVMLAATVGTLPSGGCFSYYSQDGMTQFVDCGYGPNPVDPAKSGF
jgi:hypothetical protein